MISETIQTPHDTDGNTEIQLGKRRGQGQSKLGADPGLESGLSNNCLWLFLHLVSGPREGGENKLLTQHLL